jgi:uncharacterized protein YkwD
MIRSLTLILVLCGATAASAVEPPAVDPSAADSNEITAENVLDVMNAYRAEASLPPLHLDASLSQAAEDRMRDMEDGGWWNHESPEGTPPFVWLARHDYDYLYAGENLAAGFETARLLVESWMESPGHRANIMGAQFSDCGIAIIEGSTKGPAMGKSIVALYARRRVQMLSEK